MAAGADIPASGGDMNETSAASPQAEQDGGVRFLGVRMPERIPPLSGWFLQVFRVVWWALFLAALFGAAFIYYPQNREVLRSQSTVIATGVHYGIRDASGALITAPVSREARQQGIRKGDTILSVNGRAIPPDGDMSQRAALFNGPEGGQVLLDVQHEDGSRETIALTRRAAHVEEAFAASPFSFGTLKLLTFVLEMVYGLTLLLVSLILVLRRAREPVAALLAFGWTFTAIPFRRLGLPAVFDDISQAALFLVIPLGLSLFPDGRFVSRWNWLALLPIPIMVVAGLLNALGGIYRVSVLWVFIMLGIAVVVRYSRTPAGTERQQLKFFTLGLVLLSACMVVGMLVGIAFLLTPGEVATAAWADLVFQLLITIGFVGLSAGILISLLRYRLYDADRTISRSFAIGTLTLALVAIFAGSEKMAEVLGEEWFGRDLGAVAGGLGAAVAALFIAPLHKRLDVWAERWFQSDLTELRYDVPDLVADWRETMSPAEIGDAVLERVVPTVRAMSGAVSLGGEVIATEQVERGAALAWMAEHDTPAKKLLEQDIGAEPFTTRLSLEAAGHGRIGWLLLGPRPDGSPLGKDEREALLAIADPLARALRVARDRDAKERAGEKRIGLLEQAIAELRTTLEAMAKGKDEREAGSAA